ncbi:MAG: hypothetical protein O7C75_03570, partial [Verrucomicrobia bacterium]|nr:hypothetical protein [Verrucomicrobiota bacterium]
PVVLSRYQEGYHWHHDSLPEGWMLKVVKPGRYRLRFTDSKKYPFSLDDFWKQHSQAKAVIKWKDNIHHELLKPGASFVDVSLTGGDGRLDVYFEVEKNGKIEKNWNSDISVEYLPNENL